MDAQPVIDRIKLAIADLGNRVHSAADLARLTATGGEPQVTPVAYVIPSGLQGGPHSGQTGAYVQPLDQLWSVILVLRTDTAGLRALDRIGALVRAIVDCLAGWDTGLRGVWVFRRAQLVPSAPGSLSYEITFSVGDTIRKVT